MAAAHYLKLRNTPAVVIEPSPILGGLLRTEQVEGCTVEAGADSWLAAKPWARELAGELGLGQQVIGSNDSMRRVQVLRRGKLVPYPSGMQLVVPRRLKTVWTSPLFSFRTKLRMTADFRRNDAGLRPERSVADFVRDHFGQGAVDYLAEPLLSGIYGGSPEVLSADSVLPKLVERERLHGSVTRTAAADPEAKSPVFESMRGGLAQLIQGLTPERRITGTAETLERLGDGWQVRVAGDWLAASRVIIACPAHRAAHLLQSFDPEVSGMLGAIRHSSAHIVAMSFRGLPTLPGFGLLVPRVEGHNLMAATWVSTKFNGRVPPGVQLVRAFFRSPPADPLEELQRVTRIRAAPEFLRTYQWPLSLPQYAIGHAALIEQVERKVKSYNGLSLIGNAYHGVGIPDCVRMAKAAAGE